MTRISFLLQDLRLALRRLRTAPVFAALAVAILSLALGAHLTIVGLIDTAFLRPLPVPDADRLLGVYERRDGDGFYPLPYIDYLVYKEQTRAFAELAAHYETAPLNLDLGDAAEVINGAVVTANYFKVLGIEPTVGRFFAAEEDVTPGSHPVVVLGHDLWQSRFGGRRDVLGEEMTINSTVFTVVGVAPAGFQGLGQGRSNALFMPAMMAGTGYRWCDALGERSCRIFDLVGRLAPGHSRRTAQAELDLLARNVHAEAANDEVERGVAVAPLTGFRSETGSAWRRLAGLMLAVVTLLVMVAAANLSGLLIGRGIARRKEVAVRLALGASRSRMVSQFVSEALLLSIGGSLGALLMVPWLTPLASRVFATSVPLEVSIGPPVLGYAAALCVLIGLAVGLVPGARATQTDLEAALRDEVGVSTRRSRLMATFVVVQIAVSLMLVCAAGLLTKSVFEVSRMEGVDPSSVAILRLRARLVGYNPERGQALVRESVRQIAALPGVEAVGFGQLLPIWPGYDTHLGLPGEPDLPAAARRSAEVQPLGPGSFEALGIPVLRGRDFDHRDIAGAEPVVLVNRSLADRLWPDQDPVGRAVVLGDETHRVIGVVRDARGLDLLRGAQPRAYTAFWQDRARTDARIVVRTAGDAGPLLPVLRGLVYAIDPALPVTELATLEQDLREAFAASRTASRLTATVGVLAALLAAVGLAGILALTVSQRYREIGIRRALGARDRQAVAPVVRDALLLVGAALGLGLAGIVGVGPAIAPFLHGVGPYDPWILLAAAALLASTAALASWLPARRATRIDPMTALRRP